MAWTDPTDYTPNAIPTTSGAETNNVNAKLVAKLKQLHNYLVGADSDITFNFALSDSLGASLFTISNSGGTAKIQFDSTGQLRAGAIDAEVLAAQFPGDATVATKVNNVRLLSPYTFNCTELAAATDDGTPPSTTMNWRVVNSVAGTIGTVSISGGSSIGSANITAVSITKNSVFTFDTVNIGSPNPGRDVNIQIRGYRTGTINL